MRYSTGRDDFLVGDFIVASLLPREVWPREIQERIALSDRAAIYFVARGPLTDSDDPSDDWGVHPDLFDAESVKWALQVSDACFVYTQDDENFPLSHFVGQVRKPRIITFIRTIEQFQPLWMRISRETIGYRAFSVPAEPHNGLRQ